MNNPRQMRGVQIWSRLRVRMATSYITITLVIVLLFESVLVGAVFYILTRSPLMSYLTMQRAFMTAQIYALQAAVQMDETALNTKTTFESGKARSLSLESEVNSSEAPWFSLSILYMEPGFGVPKQVPVGLLIGPDQRILASSYPDRYPVASETTKSLPEDIGLIRDALAGNSHGIVRTTHTGRIVSVAHTIWSRDRKILGAIYIQAPTGTPPTKGLLAELVSILIPSGLIWLGLMLPIGVVFGGLSTRGLIDRMERLAHATVRFKDGDASIRVPVGRADEIGQLESQFNEMTEQLVESFAQSQVLAEQGARREERARIEQEMRSAHYIQRSLLPNEMPDVPGWNIQAFYQPARDVGGDLYDIMTLPDGQIGIVIGDATGHGVPSALIMATTSAMLHATAASGAISPGKVLWQVNNLLQKHIPNGTFATCFYAILDPASGLLRFANAGHNLPFLMQNGEFFEIHAKGMPLGLMPEQEYADGEVAITLHDSILFYTDGLVEAHNEEREMYGSPRLKQRILENLHNECLIEILEKDLQDFTGSTWEQEDDVTLVLLRRNGDSTKSCDV